MSDHAPRYVTISTGADAGKVFAISLLPAVRAEEWALRAYVLALRAGVTIPDDLAGAGLAGLAAGDWSGLAALAWADVHPLLAEMMRCITYVPDPKRRDDARNPGPADIEDVGTVVALRFEWIKLHLPVLASLRPAAVLPGIVTSPPFSPALAAAAPAGTA